MNITEFAESLERVAEIQRKAGWSERSIQLYANEQRATSLDDTGTPFSSILMIGAGLACDNSRFGVFK